MYFKNINDLDQAKLHYRTLAKQLHPDKGGSITEFQQMQQEYKTLLLQLQSPNQKSVILSELGKLAKTLIEKQVPQNYLKEKIKNSQSTFEKGIFTDLVNLLDKL